LVERPDLDLDSFFENLKGVKENVRHRVNIFSGLNDIARDLDSFIKKDPFIKKDSLIKKY